MPDRPSRVTLNAAWRKPTAPATRRRPSARRAATRSGSGRAAGRARRCARAARRSARPAARARSGPSSSAGSSPYGGSTTPLLVEEAVLANGVVDQPRRRAQRAQLRRIAVRARVARAATTRAGASDSSTAEHRLAAEVARRAGDDVAEAAQGRRGRRRRGTRAGRRRRARAGAGGTPAASRRRSCRRAPRSPQSSSGFSSSLARTTDPSGRDDLGADEVVAGEAVLGGQVADAAAEGEPAHACRADDAAGRDEAEGLRRRVEVEPGRAALGAGDPRVAVDLDPRISERSITSPSSQTQCPAGLWPPPRTATSSPCARAKSNAVATSPAPVQRAITAGRRSTSALKQRRARVVAGVGRGRGRRRRATAQLVERSAAWRSRSSVGAGW